ncbi:MAG: OmpA family protein [Spirochaetota bacterium]|nr:OmpA family protein [Spirochaetota bacterium]
MSAFLTVEVEHSHYTRIFDLDQANSITLSLTTLVDYQKKAEIKIYFVDDQRKELVYTYLVDPIPRAKAGEPQILLKADFNGKYSLILDFSLNGQQLSREKISLRRYLKGKAELSPWLLLIPAVLVIAGAILVLPRSCAADRETTTTVTRRETVRTEEPQIEAAETEAGAQETEAPGTEAPTAELPVTGTETADDQPPEAPEAGPASESASGTETGSAAGSEAPFMLSKTIYFDPDSTVLTRRARTELQEVARLLEERDDIQVEIIGHCALYGTEEGRAEISRLRARNTEAYLRSQGWNPASLPSVSGRGAREPVTRVKEEQYRNRRVEIIAVQGDSSTDARQDQ